MGYRLYSAIIKSSLGMLIFEVLLELVANVILELLKALRDETTCGHSDEDTDLSLY